MRCAHCEAEFTPKRITGKFCSAKCRAAAWQHKRRDDLGMIEDQLTRALARLQTLRGREDGKGGRLWL
jgi:hypothetical protein